MFPPLNNLMQMMTLRHSLPGYGGKRRKVRHQTVCQKQLLEADGGQVTSIDSDPPPPLHPR